jgi:hypothetical protein
MPEYWRETLDAVNAILLDMSYQGERLNERYLHHAFSHQIQCGEPNPLDLVGPAAALRLHPEWATYKQETGIRFGKYRKEGRCYQPVEDGTKGGFVDFALGPYTTPKVAVEFKLYSTSGWKQEGIVYDFLKLLDGRNPFQAVVSVIVLHRRNGLPNGHGGNIVPYVNQAYQDALARLGTGPFRPNPDRLQRFILTEIAPNGRRHWFSGGFAEVAGVPPLPE